VCGHRCGHKIQASGGGASIQMYRQNQPLPQTRPGEGPRFVGPSTHRRTIAPRTARPTPWRTASTPLSNLSHTCTSRRKPSRSKPQMIRPPRSEPQKPFVVMRGAVPKQACLRCLPVSRTARDRRMFHGERGESGSTRPQGLDEASQIFTCPMSHAHSSAKPPNNETTPPVRTLCVPRLSKTRLI
jgi:hypothetical protein